MITSFGESRAEGGEKNLQQKQIRLTTEPSREDEEQEREKKLFKQY
jgi:hypothetical protein